MNPWAGLLIPAPLRMMLGDQAGQNGEAQPALSPIDFAAPEAPGAIADAPEILGNEAGELRGQWPTFMRVSEGENPLDTPKRNWAQHVYDIAGNSSPDSFRLKKGSLNGAQLMDEWGREPTESIQARIMGQGFPLDRLPETTFEKSPWSFGTFDPKNHVLNINKDALVGLKYPESETLLHGTAAHEIEHALDYMRNPVDYSRGLDAFRDTLNILERRQFFPDRPYSNDNLFQSGLNTDPRRMAFLNEAQQNPAVYKSIPPQIQEMLDRGHSPEEVMHFLNQQDDYQGARSGLDSALAQQYRYAAGNGGFRSNNPFLLDRLHSAGHWTGVQSDLDIAPKYMAQYEAKQGNPNIHPDWVDEGVQRARDMYQSPMVNVPAQIPPEAQQPTLGDFMLGGGVGAGLGFGSAEVGRILGNNIWRLINPDTPKDDDL